jgi:hypothetical protein
MAQIGTIKLESQNNGIVSVPVFDIGDSASDIYEMVRVKTTSGTGFIPVTDTGNAAYPFFRVQTENNGTVAVTDTKGSTIPDSAIARWPISSGSGTTVSDTIGDSDGTLSAEFWLSGTWVDGYALQGDATDNHMDTGNNAGITGTIAIALTVETPSSFVTSQNAYIASGGYDGSDHAWFLRFDGGSSTIVGGSNSGTRVSYSYSNISTLTKYRVVLQYDGTNWELWFDGSNVASTSSSTGAVSSTARRAFLGFDNHGSITDHTAANIDDVIVANESWTEQEIQGDYNRQPWS